MRLIVKEILIEDESIIIRHSIPVSQPPNDNDPKSPPSLPGVPGDKSYLLRSGRRDTALWGPDPLLQLRGVGLDPPKDGGVVDRDAAIMQHKFEIAIADRELEIPAHRPEDHLGGELPSLERLILPYSCCSSSSCHAVVCTRAGRQHKDATEPEN